MADHRMPDTILEVARDAGLGGTDLSNRDMVSPILPNPDYEAPLLAISALLELVAQRRR